MVQAIESRGSVLNDRCAYSTESIEAAPGSGIHPCFT